MLACYFSHVRGIVILFTRYVPYIFSLLGLDGHDDVLSGKPFVREAEGQEEKEEEVYRK